MYSAAPNVPTIRNFSWFSLLFQIALILLINLLFEYFKLPEPFILSAVFYCLTALTLRILIAKHHRAGMKLVQQRKFSQAVPVFEQSLTYFEQHLWVDRFRFVTMLSASKISYREMALCNIAFSYSQIGNGKKAIEFYNKALEINPNNGLAISALNMLTANKK